MERQGLIIQGPLKENAKLKVAFRWLDWRKNEIKCFELPVYVQYLDKLILPKGAHLKDDFELIITVEE